MPERPIEANYLFHLPAAFHQKWSIVSGRCG